MSEALSGLRRRLDEIDEEILRLLRERNEVVSQVSLTKLEEAQPIFVPAREAEKAVRFRKQAEEQGIDPEWAEDFLRMIMSASRAQQSEARFPSATEEPRTVLLVGGQGGMGQLYAGLLQATGHRVRILDREDWERVAELASGIDVAVVAVPIRQTGEVIRRLAPHLDPRCLLADFTSTKSDSLRTMLDSHTGPVVGLHPMHGPDVGNVSKQLLVVCPGRHPEASRWLIQQCELWGMRVAEVDPAGHDQVMNLVQGLRHFLALLHGSFLSSFGMEPAEVLKFSSPIYRAELMMVGRIFAQDAELYADIVFSSSERRRLLVEFFRHHERLSELVRKDDKEGFIREFEAISAYFGRFAEQALEESGYLIYRLSDRYA